MAACAGWRLSTPERTAPDPTGDAFIGAKKLMDRALTQHGPRCTRYQQRLDAWMATRKRANEAAKVRFAAERMVVLLSYITAEKPVGRVAPMRNTEKCAEAAKSLDKALNFWSRRDNRDLKQYEWMLTALVFGVAPAKIYWAYDRVEESWRIPKVDPVTQQPAGEEWVTEEVDAKNQPSMALIDPRDFAWDPAATASDLSDADYVCYWTYPTLRAVKALDVKRGTPERPGIYHGTDELKPETEGQPQSQGQRKGRDLTGHVELCEVWTRDRLLVVANGTTLIRDDPNPFLHHDLPFIIGTTQVSLDGGLEPASEIDLITPIQNDLWVIYAAYRKNLRLATKLITLFDGTMSDTQQEKVVNALRGENDFVAIPVDADGSFTPITWSPTTALLAAGQAGMEGYKRDMDDMSGIGPYVSGQAEKNLDPKTATEVSTEQSASMRRISMTRNMLNNASQRGRNLELKLIKQFMDKALEIRIEGYDPDATMPGQDWSWDHVDPAKVMDADLEYVIRNADESMDQEQKRSEAAMRFQTALAAFPAMQAAGQGTPNLAKEYENFLEAYGVADAKEWLVAPPPPLPLVPELSPNGAAPSGSGGFFGATPPGAPTPSGPAQAAPSPRRPLVPA